MFYMASEQAEADGLDVETNVDKADAEPKKDLPLLPVDSIVQLLLRAKKQLKLQEAAQYLVGKAGGSLPPCTFTVNRSTLASCSPRSGLLCLDFLLLARLAPSIPLIGFLDVCSSLAPSRALLGLL